MSDINIVNPDDPFGNHPDAIHGGGGTTSGLEQGTLADYLPNWAESTYIYNLGETFPLKWSITRADAEDVDVPSAGAINITDVSTGDLTDDSPLTPVVEDSGPVPMQIVGQLWTPPASGLYEAVLTVTIESQ